MIGPPLVDSLLAGTSPFTGAGWLKAARPGGAVRLHMFLSAGAYRGFPRGFSRNALYRFSPVWAFLFFLVGGIFTYCGGFSLGLCTLVLRLLGASLLGVSPLGPSATTGGSVALEGVLDVAIGP